MPASITLATLVLLLLLAAEPEPGLLICWQTGALPVLAVQVLVFVEGLPLMVRVMAPPVCLTELMVGSPGWV